MNISKTSFSFLVFISFICLLFNPTIGLAKIHHLTILHTSEHRGHFAKFSWNGIPDVGGMAARSTLVNIVRAEIEQAGGYVLLLSPGGVNIGTPESDLLYAEPDFKLMHMLGYDAMTLGSLEFHNPREVLMKQREWAGFPFLSANMVKKETGELLDFVEPYIIKAFDDLHVAIFGLTTEETTKSFTAAEDLNARNGIEVAKALVPKLRSEADIVIALTSLGFQAISDFGPRTPGDVELAKAVSGIDVIVGGKTGTILEETEVIGDTLIVQAGVNGLYVGRLDLTIDSEIDKIIESTYRLIPINLKKRVEYQGRSYYTYVDTGYVEDPAVLEFMQPYLEQTEQLLSQPVGEALVRLDGDWNLVTTQETNLANLVTDAMRAKTGAEIAFCNAGEIMASIEPGPISYRDILKVHPWGSGSTLVLLDMTGEQIMDVLRYAATIKSGEGGFLQAASGLTWTNNKGIPEDVMVGNAPIELEKTYKVVTIRFLADGYEGYTMFKDVPQYDTGFIDASALREYIIKRGKVAPKVEGRLTIIE